mmetsp:Transcript_23679/g.37800  ORF Transcript_23679/g.37800 Transcript_23679/m.37800 type:complete len:569 (-) Transcript_23679:1642-3348(-)
MANDGGSEEDLDLVLEEEISRDRLQREKEEREENEQHERDLISVFRDELAGIHDGEPFELSGLLESLGKVSLAEKSEIDKSTKLPGEVDSKCIEIAQGLTNETVKSDKEPNAEEIKRLRFENSYLVSTETLLESKCATLDSRLEECTIELSAAKANVHDLDVCIEKQNATIKEQEGHLAYFKSLVAEQNERIRLLEKTVDEKNARIREDSQKIGQSLEQEAALEMQMRATSRACDEIGELKKYLVEVTNERDHLIGVDEEIEELKEVVRNKDLFIISLESSLESATTDAKKSKELFDTIEKENASLRADLSLRIADVDRYRRETERTCSDAALRIEELERSGLASSNAALSKAESIQTQLHDRELQLESMRGDLKQQEERVGFLEKENAELRRRLLEKDINVQMELEAEKAKCVAIEKQLKDTMGSIGKCHRSLNLEQERSRELEVTVGELRDQLTSLRHMLTDSEQQNEILRAGLEDFEQLATSSVKAERDKTSSSLDRSFEVLRLKKLRYNSPAKSRPSTPKSSSSRAKAKRPASMRSSNKHAPRYSSKSRGSLPLNLSHLLASHS